MVGRTERVLFTGYAKKDPTALMGRTGCKHVVNIKGQPRLMNQWADVNITQAFTHALRAEVLRTTEPGSA